MKLPVRREPVADPFVHEGHRAMLCMAGFAALWAAIEVIGMRLLAHHSPYQVVWVRYGVHLLFMLAVWGWREPARLWRTRRPRFHLVRSMLMLGMPVSWILAMRMGVEADTVIDVFWLSPLLILALSWLLLNEHAHLRLWLVTGVALCGAYFLHGPGHLAPIGLLALPLAMAFCFSLYVVMTRTLRREPTIVNLFWSALGVFVALTPAAPWFWTTPTLADAMAMLSIGLLGWMALWLLDRAATSAPVSATAPFAYLQLVAFAAIAGVGGLLRDESPRRMAAGAVLVACVAVYVWLRVRRMVEPDPSNTNPGNVQPAPKES